MTQKNELYRRKERRFKTCDEERLQCNTFIDVQDPVEGAIIDISPNGLRMLASGEFKVGQAFITELITDKMEGLFPGVIRRIAPWTDGKFVLGCQLLEPIPDELLDSLALDGIINRRRDHRVQWAQSARMSCELRRGEEEIEIRDCSHGGLKIISKTPLPEGVMLRIRTEADDEKLVIDAKTVWQSESEDGFQGGVAFTTRDVPEAVARILERGERVENTSEPKKRPFGLMLMLATVVVIACFAVTQV